MQKNNLTHLKAPLPLQLLRRILHKWLLMKRDLSLPCMMMPRPMLVPLHNPAHKHNGQNQQRRERYRNLHISFSFVDGKIIFSDPENLNIYSGPTTMSGDYVISTGLAVSAGLSNPTFEACHLCGFDHKGNFHPTRLVWSLARR
jgi:hypothetical protein